MNKLIAYIGILIISSFNSFGQDIHFSQFDKAPILLNPGLTGMGKGFNRANINYRNQWGSLNQIYSTMGASIDMPILSSKMDASNGYLGVGIDFFSDDAGDGKFKTMHFGFTLSGVMYSGKNSSISLGLNASYEQRSISPDNVSWDNQWNGLTYDPSLPSRENWGNQSNSYFDMASGFAWKYVQPNIGVSAFDKLSASAGVAYFHILNPDLSFYGFSGDERYGRLVLHAQGSFGLRDQYITINPGVFFSHQGPYNEFLIGSTFKYLFRSDTKYTGFINEKAIGIGLFVRGQDALIPSIIFEFKGFEIAINYDYTISTLQKANNGYGGFEISLQWQDTYGILFKQGDKHVMYLE